MRIQRLAQLQLQWECTILYGPYQVLTEKDWPGGGSGQIICVDMSPSRRWTLIPSLQYELDLVTRFQQREYGKWKTNFIVEKTAQDQGHINQEVMRTSCSLI